MVAGGVSALIMLTLVSKYLDGTNIGHQGKSHTVSPSTEMDLEYIADYSTSDVRLTDGINKINANKSTIDAMKFLNGVTGNREERFEFV